MEAEFSLAEELRAFLRGHAAALDPSTTMSLLSAHGRSEEALFYATLVQDYERVLAHHASSNSNSSGKGPDYKAALDVLRKVCILAFFFGISFLFLCFYGVFVVMFMLAFSPSSPSPDAGCVPLPHLRITLENYEIIDGNGGVR